MTEVKAPHRNGRAKFGDLSDSAVHHESVENYEAEYAKQGNPFCDGYSFDHMRDLNLSDTSPLFPVPNGHLEYVMEDAGILPFKYNSSTISVLEEDDLQYQPPSQDQYSFLAKLDEVKPAEVKEDNPVLRWFGITRPCAETKVKLGAYVSEVRKQPCYYIQLKQKDRFHTIPIRNRQPEGKRALRQLLGDGAVHSRGAKEAFESPDNDFIVGPFQPQKQFIVEIGPKLRHRTPWCVNVVSICHAADLPVKRIEKTWRYLITVESQEDILETKKKVIDILHDPVLEQVYEKHLVSFHDEEPRKEYLWVEIPLLTVGKSLLKETSDKHAFGFDNADIDFYFDLFMKQLRRNPTIPELVDLAQSNSEHSRHWFFKGKYILDEKPLEKSLMDMVIETNGETTNQNNVIKFHDNSSAISGFKVTSLIPSDPRVMSQFMCEDSMKHLLLTAETHNFPTGVAPFSGSATGVGGRIRDVMAAGRGGYVLTATAGYCVGQLNFPDNKLPWEAEEDTMGYFESALKIIIEASNGASDYGNKFGEPLISGFFRAFGGKLGSEWREWLKPIMFSAGVGMLDEKHVAKSSSRSPACNPLQIGKIGGPAYRIGIGGGAASSVEVQGASGNRTVNAVQRGDPEMGNKLNRFVRACIEMGEKNPILSIHDQGAGGNANVLKEIVEGKGAEIYARAFTVGDSTLTLEELWCAEYQESNAILFDNRGHSSLRQIAEREKCDFDIVGRLRNDQKFQLHSTLGYEMAIDDSLPVDFPLDIVMEGLPRKSYKWTSEREESSPLKLHEDVTAEEAMERVLKLPSVASKRFLTSKVDRSVTGLVAQQQCVGEHQLPLADVAVTACSYFSHEGIATSTGEQPIITTVNPAAGARMSLMEALAGIVMAPISALKDVKCSVNWMWPAKLKGEGASMYEACSGLCELMKTIGVGIDGGKDSLGMAAQTLNSNGEPKEVVKAPGTVVVTAYAQCLDITKVLTPDIKGSKRKLETRLLWVRPALKLRARLGGSALAQVYAGLGAETPDFTGDDAKLFIKAFDVIQSLITDGELLAGHDVSEGGVVTCLAEMAFAGCCGLDILLPHLAEQQSERANSPDQVEPDVAALFAEEIGWVFEVEYGKVEEIMKKFTGIPCFQIGGPTIAPGDRERFVIRGGEEKNVWIKMDIIKMRQAWEQTSLQLELYQTNASCALQEYESLLQEKTVDTYKIKFDYRPRLTVEEMRKAAALGADTPRVAVLREEGTNGDREMAAAFLMAGFAVYDLTMTDLLKGCENIHQFRGLAFPGGFSYADVLGGGVGWSASLKGGSRAECALENWRADPRNFSLAVCNGCQLVAMLGWQNLDSGIILGSQLPDHRFKTNLSGRFESRWSRVKVGKTRNLFLKGMAGSVLGIWSAHKEGRFECTENVKIDDYFSHDMVALRYVDDNDRPTEDYPMNPNGSQRGIAGLSSECGRHLALMPHPERCVLPWQWPYKGHFPEKTQISGPTEGNCFTDTAPWAKIFQNAYDWCIEPEAFDVPGIHEMMQAEMGSP